MANFAQLKETISIKQVMDHYDMEYTRVNGELQSDCPVCGGEKAFKANVENNMWNCFSGNCAAGKKGNILGLVEKIEDVSVRKAGNLLEKWFIKEEEEEPKSDFGNPPVGDKLDHIPALLDPGNTDHFPETARYFEAGHCRSGLMKGRVSVPIHDHTGALVGYVGMGDPPKYPKGFKVGHELYNLHRITGKYVIVVQDIYDVWNLYENGKPAIAVLGDWKDEHTKLLQQAGIKYIGIYNTELLFLFHHFFVKCLEP